MKINVHAGHTSQKGNAPGASGIVHESVENRKIVKELIEVLESRGATVYDCTSEGKNSSDNLYQIVKKCNAHKVDLDVSIHLNDYNDHAHGTETLIYAANSKAKPYAEKIDKNLAGLGFTDRGVKIRTGLYVLRRTNAPALLVECFFDDSKKDVDLYKKVGVKGIAKAIADGILPEGKAKETKKETPKKKATPKKTTPAKTKKATKKVAQEVIDGKYGNGDARKKKLKEAGYDPKEVQALVNEMVKKK